MPTNRKRLQTPPSVVQLPGGVKLQGIPFRIVDRNEDGSPKTFEIMAQDDVKKCDCVLWADAEWIRRGT